MAKIYIFHCILAHDDRNYCYGKVFYGGIFFENDKVYKVCKVLGTLWSSNNKWTPIWTFNQKLQKCVAALYGNCSSFNAFTNKEEFENKCVLPKMEKIDDKPVKTLILEKNSMLNEKDEEINLEPKNANKSVVKVNLNGSSIFSAINTCKGELYAKKLFTVF